MKKKYIWMVIAAVIVVAAGVFVYITFLGNKVIAQTSGTIDASTMTLETKLAIGILKLEGTDNAVTAEQAKELLPLWKGVKVFSNSDTISDAEMEALYQQIQETLTTAQLQAINAMDLSDQDMTTIASDLGVTMGFRPGISSTPGASMDQMPGNNMGFPGGDVVVPGGNMGRGAGDPGGMAGGMGGGAGMPSGNDMGMGGIMPGTDTQTDGTDTATTTARTTAMNNPFLDVLINLLKTRATE
jgi:hypothetical protein